MSMYKSYLRWLKGAPAETSEKIKRVYHARTNRTLGMGKRQCRESFSVQPGSASGSEFRERTGKSNCVDDASRLMNPKSLPGEGKIRFSRSESPA